MCWPLVALLWWCGASAVAAPGPGTEWQCPEIALQPQVECSCDMPHTLRCTGDKHAMQIIGRKLRSLDRLDSVSLLDCTVQNVSSLSGPLLEGVSLHGLVVSSGEIKDVHHSAFAGLATPLQALGLPNNQLRAIPTLALAALPELDRLDLSSNQLESLDEGSFKGLYNLSFVELSDNFLTNISPKTFTSLIQLRILRLRGNRLSIATISKFESLPNIEELDLSSNSLIGPIGPTTFPDLDNLKDLQLAHNSFSSIRRGALELLTNLTSLSLHHNQIDVLEDHAFLHLSALIHLDLSHNRIVAVSGSSLAHLENLMDLDLRHNFLRAMTADLILPLTSLKKLRLDENDISIIASDALRGDTILSELTLSDNPLNCDCSLIDFATWLSNSTLSKEDKSSAVCTTPPSLENGLLIEVPTSDLLCGEDEQEALMAPLAAPIKTRVTLSSYSYDGRVVGLQWKVEASAIPYTCDAIFVYEEEASNEVLLESNPLRCNSSDVHDARVLNVTVPASSELREGRRYRYCVVLLESGQHTDDLSLVLGCSDVIPLVPDVGSVVPPRSRHEVPLARVTSLQANLTSYGSLSLEVAVWPLTATTTTPPQPPCELNVAVLQQGAVKFQKRINCSETRQVFAGLREGPYRVCANVVYPGRPETGGGGGVQRPRCATASTREPRGLSGLDVAFVAVFLVLSFMLIVLIWGVRKMLLRPKIQTHQCFMPPEREEQQHSRYVKLQATTKL